MITRKIISIIIPIIVLTSCHKRSELTVSRVIVNTTNHSIKIESFSAGFLTGTIEINPFQRDSTSSKCYFERGHHRNCSLEFSVVNDSMSVTFDNERSISYCSRSSEICNTDEKNIMYLHGGAGYTLEKNGVYRFEITEEDYNTATIIE